MAEHHTDYEEKKSRERAWYKSGLRDTVGPLGKLLRSPVFYSLDRVLYNYVHPKEQMAQFARRSLEHQAERVLVAPCGRGDDLKYVKGLGQKVHGVDLSAFAVQSSPKGMDGIVGDILTLPYGSGCFELVFSPLFFHHMREFGFEPFLEEFYRVLKPGGTLIVLEPSLWYPLNFVTRPLKLIASNPFDEVEDEGPFRPGRMLRSLRAAGFQRVELQAATFSHCSFYIPLARIVNRLSRAVMGTWPFTYLGWLVLYRGVKVE